MANRDQAFGEVRFQNVVVIFADILGFTAFSERAGPEATLALLRKFHDQIQEVIFQHNETLDNLPGDGVMASFGVPYTSPDDRQRALGCVVDVAALTPPDDLTVSVGARYGLVVLGDVGSRRRLEFATLETP